jgi:hypothetical protein
VDYIHIDSVDSLSSCARFDLSDSFNIGEAKNNCTSRSLDNTSHVIYLSLPSTRYELEGFEEQQMESVYVYTSSS